MPIGVALSKEQRIMPYVRDWIILWNYPMTEFLGLLPPIRKTVIKTKTIKDAISSMIIKHSQGNESAW